MNTAVSSIICRQLARPFVRLVHDAAVNGGNSNACNNLVNKAAVNNVGKLDAAIPNVTDNATSPFPEASALIQRMSSMNRYDSILEGVTPVGGTPGNLVYEMKIQPRHTNYFSTLHGGMVASLVDALTTVSQCSAGLAPGVTAGLQINYYRAPRLGDTIVIDTQTVITGQNMYHANVYIKDKATGKMLQHGCHIKFVGAKLADVKVDSKNFHPF